MKVLTIHDLGRKQNAIKSHVPDINEFLLCLVSNLLFSATCKFSSPILHFSSRVDVLVFVLCSGNRLDRWWCFVIPISKLQREKEKLLFFGKQLEREENIFWLIVVFLSASLSDPCSKFQTHWSYPCLVCLEWTMFFQHHLMPSLMNFDLSCLVLLKSCCCVFDDSQNNILIVYLDF